MCDLRDHLNSYCLLNHLFEKLVEYLFSLILFNIYCGTLLLLQVYHKYFMQLIIGLLVIAVLISGCTTTTTTQTNPPPTPAATTASTPTVTAQPIKTVMPTTVQPTQTPTAININIKSYTFNQAGTFEYGCTIHTIIPHGKVIVT